MTKQEEIDLLKTFVGNLPEGYLKDALAPFVPDFECGIRSDIVPSVWDSYHARVKADEDRDRSERLARIAKSQADKEEQRLLAAQRAVDGYAASIKQTLRSLTGN